VLVDGAQTAGVLPLDLAALGVDYYTVSGQKWLCGPEGTGALFVASHRPALTPGLGSVFNVEHHDFLGQITLRADARRYECSMIHRPSLAGFAASLAWILDEVKVGRAWQRSLELADSCRRQLAGIDGIEIVTPEALASPLVTCDLPGWSPAKLHSAARQLVDRERIICRSIDHPPYGLRAAFGFFNTEPEVARFVEAVARLWAAGPDAVPLAGWAQRLPDARVSEKEECT
jgi:L-cysteine/cystine lyase